MSRAFVKEADEELASYREGASHDKKTLEWVKIQEKKLDFLMNDPHGKSIDPAKREKWIAEARAAIASVHDAQAKDGGS
jgi:hypothetical protein